MCLILFSHSLHPRYALILAANRDEFYDRPSRPSQFWEKPTEILAGRDMRSQGTWLGISRKGRFAAITNFRDPGALLPKAPSRGFLVRDFLCGHGSPLTDMERIQADGNRYNGFNLIAGEPEALYYYSNKTSGIQRISPGIHALSNSLIDVPWPKVVRGKNAFKALINGSETIAPDALFQILADTMIPPDDQLPDTRIGLAWERILSPLFIRSEFYGTRASTVVLIERSGRVMFAERVYDPNASAERGRTTRHFRFSIK